MRNLILLPLILVVSVFLAPSSVAAQPKVTGVSDTEVVIGWTTPLSGPAALWGVTGLGGKAWADHINDQGGVHGRKLKVILKDDGYNPTRAMTNLQQMKGQVFAVCGLLGTAILNAAKDYFPDNNIPLITAYGDVSIWARLPRERLSNIFIAYPDYEDEAEYVTKYALKNLNAKRIALFYQNDDYGKKAWLGVKDGLAAMPGEAELVATVPYEVTERSLGTHALKLKESKADTVIIYPTPTHGALILKEMAKIGYQPKVLTTFTLGDPIMYRLAGEAWEGTYIALPGNSGVPGSDAEADRVVEILKRQNRKIKGKEYLALFGAMSMIHLVEGLKNAGRNLTPETMVSGMEMIKDWTPQGIGAPVTYNPVLHHGNNASRMSQARNGKHVPIEPFTIFEPRF
jgi:ABC-type branched-subunit amino acid transport system substrate-binding protein